MEEPLSVLLTGCDCIVQNEPDGVEKVRFARSISSDYGKVGSASKSEVTARKRDH